MHFYKPEGFEGSKYPEEPGAAFSIMKVKPGYKSFWLFSTCTAVNQVLERVPDALANFSKLDNDKSKVLCCVGRQLTCFLSLLVFPHLLRFYLEFYFHFPFSSFAVVFTALPSPNDQSYKIDYFLQEYNTLISEQFLDALFVQKLRQFCQTGQKAYNTAKTQISALQTHLLCIGGSVISGDTLSSYN